MNVDLIFSSFFHILYIYETCFLKRKKNISKYNNISRLTDNVDFFEDAPLLTVQSNSSMQVGKFLSVEILHTSKYLLYCTN